MTVFQYDTHILTRYPNIAGGVILARGMKNGPTPDAALKDLLVLLQMYAGGTFISDRLGATIPMISDAVA